MRTRVKCLSYNFAATPITRNDAMSHTDSGVYEAFAEYARTIRESIEQIESDRVLLRSGHQLLFAVDFAEIRQCLQPRTDVDGSLMTAAIPGESTENRYARQQLAYSSIFGQLGHDLLILPPHQIEMSDHFHLRRSLYQQQGVRDPHRIEEYLARHLTDHRGFRAIAAMLEKDPDSEALTSEKMKRISLYVRENFKELMFLTLPHPYGRVEEDEPVRHMLQHLGIRPYADFFKDSELQFDALFPGSAAWFDILNDGKHPEGECAAYTDSLACAYLEQTNGMINPRNESLLFITSSRTVAAALREKELGRSGSTMHRASLTRDVNYFSTLFHHRRNDPREMDEELARTMRHCEELCRILGEAVQPRAEELPASFEKASAGACDALLRAFTAKENLGLAIAGVGGSLDEGEGRSIGHLSPRNSNSIRKIVRLVATNEDVRGVLREDFARVATGIARHLSDMDLLLNSRRRGVRQFHQSRAYISAADSKLILESLASEMPAEVYVHNPHVHRIAFSVLSRYGKQFTNKAWHAGILTLASVQAGVPELHTLRAYHFATIENWSSALSEVRMGLRDRPLSDDARRELLHIKTVVHRMQDQTADGLIACTDGLKLSASDPRLSHELAILLWQVLQSKHPAERKSLTDLVKRLIGQETDYVMALDAVGRALEALGSSATGLDGDQRLPLYSHALNTSAFLALEIFRVRRDVMYLKLAEQRMAELRAVLPEKKWVKKFFHTMGCILFERWDLSREHVDELRAAKKYLKETVGDVLMPAS